MNKPVGNEVLLTSDDIRRWQGELQKWESTKADAESRIAELRKKLDAAALLFGANFPVAIIDAGVDDKPQESMADAARRLLARFSKPVRHPELQAELRKVPRFREALERNNGAYYYTLIRRLVHQGDVKKVGKKILLIHKNEAPSEDTSEGAPKATVEG